MRIEGALYMGYPRLALGRCHRNNIEAHRGLQQIVAGHVVEGRTADLALLVPGDRFQRMAVANRLSGFYLYKDMVSAVETDNINFPTFLPVIPGQNTISQLHQVSNGKFFA